VNFEAFDIYSSGLAPSGVTLSLAGTAISDTFIAFSREIVGDPVDALERLGGRGVCTASEWTEDEIRGYRSQVRSELMRLDRVDNGLSVTDAVGALADALPGGAAVVADAGFSKPLLLHLWEPAKPKLFYASHSFGTMGHALPTAIALKLHSPDRPTVAVMGDGSLLMRVGELQTAADALVNPIVVVFMDGSLTQIAIKQTRRGLPKTGVDLPKLSAEAIATAFGCVGLDVYTAEDIGKAMAAALTSREVSVIGVHVDNRNANDVFEYIRG
jgi:thiamine pyrophosphate-dependent acetolactate synthase large subunit-like protein